MSEIIDLIDEFVKDPEKLDLVPEIKNKVNKTLSERDDFEARVSETQESNRKLLRLIDVGEPKKEKEEKKEEEVEYTQESAQEAFETLLERE